MAEETPRSATFPTYTGKRVVVTGCRSGIGRSVALALRRSGAAVHGLDLAEPDFGLDGFHTLDLRQRASIDAAAGSIEGRIDAIFNCAGIPPGAEALDVVTVNYIGPRELTRQLLDRVPAGGAVVNVASNGGARWRDRLGRLRELLGLDDFAGARRWCAASEDVARAAYSFSKEAVVVWTMAASAELIGRGIRMNCTCPGAVVTPMLDAIERVTPSDVIDAMAQPIGRRSTPEEQAWPLLFLNSDLASYVNGAVLQADGGFMAAQTAGTGGEPAVGRR